MEHKKIAGACEGLRIHAEILQHRLKCAEARAVRARMSEPQFQDMTAFIPNWLYLFFMTMLLVLLFAVPFALVLHWVPTAFGDFFILGVLNIAFAQLLVILNLVKNRIIWFLLPLVGSLKMGRFCYPSADMATYLYPKALEEARGIGAPIDQMNEGEKDRAIILPNGMLIESVAEAYYARQAARARILAEGRGHVWRFVFIARVVPIKGLTDLIRSLAVLRDQGLVNFHLDVLGPKDHLPEYYELCLRTIEELDMGEYITFHGTVNVRAMLDRFDLLLMPSYNEGQPIVALEAMAASIPLVSTDVGGMSQLIDDVLVAPDGHEIGNCGILTIPGDIHGFAAALRTLMEEPSIYERYCGNAYDRIVSFCQL